MATGRPIILSCFRPAQSVQATSSSIVSSNATRPISAAIRFMVFASMPHCFSAVSGLYSSERYRSANNWKDGTAVRPSDSVNDPAIAGDISVARAGAKELVALFQQRGLPSPSRANKP